MKVGKEREMERLGISSADRREHLACNLERACKKKHSCGNAACTDCHTLLTETLIFFKNAKRKSIKWQFACERFLFFCAVCCFTVAILFFSPV